MASVFWLRYRFQEHVVIFEQLHETAEALHLSRACCLANRHHELVTAITLPVM